MSKSILVVDTPECCDYCPVGRIFGMAGQVECMEGKDIRVNNNGRIIPDWCPLRDLPEKKEEKQYLNRKDNGGNTETYGETRDMIAVGWNMCIDEILKGGGGKQK